MVVSELVVAALREPVAGLLGLEAGSIELDLVSRVHAIQQGLRH